MRDKETGERRTGKWKKESEGERVEKQEVLTLLIATSSWSKSHCHVLCTPHQIALTPDSLHTCLEMV